MIETTFIPVLKLQLLLEIPSYGIEIFFFLIFPFLCNFWKNMRIHLINDE